STCTCKHKPADIFCGDGVLGCLRGHEYVCTNTSVTACDFGITPKCEVCTTAICPVQDR
ncbi:hypothetical protein BD410DRAFT_731848, partial [Rickenella mellea]